MKINKLNIIIVLGLIAIIGILVAQLLWTKQAFSLEEKKFSQKVHIALLEVTKKLYEGTNHDLPSENPVKKISNDYYIVNIDNDLKSSAQDFQQAIHGWYPRIIFWQLPIAQCEPFG